MTIERRGLFQIAIAATLIALVAVSVVYGIAQAVDVDLRVTALGADVSEEVPLATALVITALGGGVGLVLAAMARRFAARPAPVFLAICAVLLVLDGINPFLASDKVSTGIWLNLMHLAAAVPIVGGLYRALPARRDSPTVAGGRRIGGDPA